MDKKGRFTVIIFLIVFTLIFVLFLTLVLSTMPAEELFYWGEEVIDGGQWDFPDWGGYSNNPVGQLIIARDDLRILSFDKWHGEYYESDPPLCSIREGSNFNQVLATGSFSGRTCSFNPYVEIDEGNSFWISMEGGNMGGPDNHTGVNMTFTNVIWTNERFGGGVRFYGITEKFMNITTQRKIIDVTPPEAMIKFNPEINDLVVIGVDDLDENVDVNYTEIPSGKKHKIRLYRIEDDAGNTLDLVLKYGEFKSQISNSILSLKYNGEQIMPPYNDFIISSSKRSDKLIQELYIGEQSEITASYNIKTDKTEIRIIEGKTKQRYSDNGLILIELKTDKGDLKYNLN